MKALILDRKAAGGPYSDYQQLPLILHLNRPLNEVEGLCSWILQVLKPDRYTLCFYQSPSIYIIDRERDKIVDLNILPGNKMCSAEWHSYVSTYHRRLLD